VAGKFAKGKHKLLNGLAGKQTMDIQDMPMSEMERRLDAMSAFMTRTQLEIAGDRTPPTLGTDGALDGVPVGGAVQPPVSEPDAQRPFEEMSSMEMADVLSRNIEKWKQMYGQQARPA
jgi:hypothetical protein